MKNLLKTSAASFAILIGQLITFNQVYAGTGSRYDVNWISLGVIALLFAILGIGAFVNFLKKRHGEQGHPSN